MEHANEPWCVVGTKACAMVKESKLGDVALNALPNKGEELDETSSVLHFVPRRARADLRPDLDLVFWRGSVGGVVNGLGNRRGAILP